MKEYVLISDQEVTYEITDERADLLLARGALIVTAGELELNRDHVFQFDEVVALLKGPESGE